MDTFVYDQPDDVADGFRIAVFEQYSLGILSGSGGAMTYCEVFSYAIKTSRKVRLIRF